jgi:hydrogenase nickel incorporation protein HypB
MSENTRLVQVRQHVLKRNDTVARALRASFRAAGTYVVSLVSSPGAGKTALLEQMLGALHDRHRVAALVGDLATDNDARRLARSGAPVKQIITGTVCHLEAEMIKAALDDVPWEGLDFLFIENVGNLVCPAAFDLGEAAKVAIVSITEGDDKPLKYPDIFAVASLILVNKIDLAPYLDADVDRLIGNARRVNPDVEVLTVSARTGQGLDAWLAWLDARRIGQAA